MSKQKVGAAYGVTAFAALMLLTLGAMEVLNGLTAIANSNAQVYLKTQDNTYFLHLSSTGWGITHTLLGVLLVAAGFGVVVSVLAALAGFAFIPIYPVWGVIIVAIAVSVVWALTTYGGDLRK